MSLKTVLAPYVSRWITSEDRLNRKRRSTERRRLKAGKPHTLEYFHDATDPYSCLMAQALPKLSLKYDVEILCHLVDPPPDWAAPDREKLHTYARVDAARLAEKSGFWFQDPRAQPDGKAVATVENHLAEMIHENNFVEKSGAASIALWQGKATGSDSTDQSRQLKQRGTQRRQKLGHYLGATIYYGGEWYWGLDRLALLENRLRDLNAGRLKQDIDPVFPPPQVPELLAPVSKPDQELHFYLSFRSPYTYLAAQRVMQLADAYQARVKLRFVLPMVMRGLPVPRMKRAYIVTDAAREARRLGIPFGCINDPLGKPVARGYSLLPWARDQGRACEYAISFMRNVWAEGTDAGSNAGLKRIVEQAGLDWADAVSRIGNDDWREEAEANRAEMMSLGIWGVPAFRVGDTITWGQDRLWVIEGALAGADSEGAGSQDGD